MHPLGMMHPGPAAPAQPGGDPAMLLERAITALRGYAQAEPDPADRQAATQIVGALEALAQKDRGETARQPTTPTPTDYRQGGTVAGRFFGNQQ